MHVLINQHSHGSSRYSLPQLYWRQRDGDSGMHHLIGCDVAIKAFGERENCNSSSTQQQQLRQSQDGKKHSVLLRHGLPVDCWLIPLC